MGSGTDLSSDLSSLAGIGKVGQRQGFHRGGTESQRKAKVTECRRFCGSRSGVSISQLHSARKKGAEEAEVTCCQPRRPGYNRGVEEGERPQGVAQKREDEPMLYCPVCSTRLTERKCKLICETCGYYLSCADYY